MLAAAPTMLGGTNSRGDANAAGGGGHWPRFHSHRFPEDPSESAGRCLGPGQCLLRGTGCRRARGDPWLVPCAHRATLRTSVSTFRLNYPPPEKNPQKSEGNPIWLLFSMGVLTNNRRPSPGRTTLMRASVVVRFCPAVVWVTRSHGYGAKNGGGYDWRRWAARRLLAARRSAVAGRRPFHG